MRKLSHREIQLYLLEILKSVDAFCVKEGIRYSMAYGTLLGAVRHKGFIPWDDDIDLLMPRPDYERFVSTFGKEPGSVTVAFVTGLASRETALSIFSLRSKMSEPKVFKAEAMNMISD